jgi:hypothetical protein
VSASLYLDVTRPEVPGVAANSFERFAVKRQDE